MKHTWDQLASDAAIEKTIAGLKENNIDAEVVMTGEDAKARVVSLLPKNAEVMNMTSVTLDTIGLSKEIMESGKYRSIKNILVKMDRTKDGMEMQKLGTAHEWALGSVHAVTEQGSVLIASNSGSQLPAYAYGAMHVIWVVSTKKIVKDLDEGLRRIYEHVLPQESERVKKVYGMKSSFVSKLLIINREPAPKRITVILVKEDLGF